MSDWKPIDTAPKDGRYLLLACLVKHTTADGGDEYDYRYRVSAYYSGRWFNVNYGKGWEDIPTHWIPIPKLPTK